MSEPQCPNGCGPLEADHVDIGVGMQRCGPYGCPECHYVEPDAQDIDEDCTCALPSNLRHEHEGRRGKPCDWCGRMVR